MNSLKSVSTSARMPALVFACVAVVWTTGFTSFDHPKLAATLIAILVMGFLIYRRGPSREVIPPAYTWMGAGVVAMGLLRLILHDGPSAGETIIHISRMIIILTFAALIHASLDTGNRSQQTRWILLTASIPIMLLAWVQYLELAPQYFPQVPGYEQPVYSVFGNQNLLGGFLAICIPLAFTMRPSGRRVLGVDLAILVLACATCMITGSRTAWLAAALGIAAGFWTRRGRNEPKLGAVTLGVAVAVVLTAILFPGPTIERLRDSFSAADEGWHIRLWIWSAAVTLVRADGLWGLGPGGFALRSPDALGDVLHSPGGMLYHSNTIPTWYAHSTPLELLLDYGLVGGVLCVAWGIALVHGRRSPLFGGAIAFTVYALFNTVTPSIPHAVAGLVLLTSLRDAEDTSSDDAPASSFAFVLGGAVVSLTSAIVVVTLLLIPDFQLARARSSFAESGADERTLRRYAKAANSRFARPEAHLEYAILLYTADPDSALTHLNLAAPDLDTGELHLMLSRLHAVLGDTESALHHARFATHRWPREISAWEQRLSLEGPNAQAVREREAKEWLGEEAWGRGDDSLQGGDR